MPDPSVLDLSMTTELTLFCLLTFATGLIFLRVATKVAPVSFAPRLLIWRTVDLEVYENLSEVNSSVLPFDRIKVYLS